MNDFYSVNYIDVCKYLWFPEKFNNILRQNNENSPIDKSWNSALIMLHRRFPGNCVANFENKSQTATNMDMIS